MELGIAWFGEVVFGGFEGCLLVVMVPCFGLRLKRWSVEIVCVEVVV